MKQFYIVGRALPDEDEPHPQLYRMRIFARDVVLARSKFWYHMKRQHKVRKIQGEIVSSSEVSQLQWRVSTEIGVDFREENW